MNVEIMQKIALFDQRFGATGLFSNQGKHILI